MSTLTKNQQQIVALATSLANRHQEYADWCEEDHRYGQECYSRARQKLFWFYAGIVAMYADELPEYWYLSTPVCFDYYY